MNPSENFSNDPDIAPISLPEAAPVAEAQPLVAPPDSAEEPAPRPWEEEIPGEPSSGQGPVSSAVESAPTGTDPLPSASESPSTGGAPAALASAPGVALAELWRIREAIPSLLEQAATQVNCGDLPFLFWGRQWSPVQKVGDHGSSKWFFIGDIHGDFFALHHLLEEVQKEPSAYVCFLGDLVDRGPHGVECFARLLEFANARFSLTGSPRVVWILGNHDEGIVYRPRGEKKFLSSVEPAEFVDYLNGELETHLTPEELVRWGQLFVDVCDRLPRALIFESGLMAAHGGIPLEDRWPFLKTFEALQHPRCLGDFTWTRATRAPFKKGWKFDAPRRAYSSSFEFGYRDFEGFCNAVAGLFKVRGLVRGHDHVAGGHESPAEYAETPLLTINGFGFNYLNNSYALYRNSLVIAVSEDGEMPRVVEVSFSPESLAEFIRSGNLVPPDSSGESGAPESLASNPVEEDSP